MKARVGARYRADATVAAATPSVSHRVVNTLRQRARHGHHGRAAGVDDYLTKPFSLDKLFEAVTLHCGPSPHLKRSPVVFWSS
jgi:DNA-binding response OmpR family regulator